MLLELTSAKDMAEHIARAEQCRTTACLCAETPWRKGCKPVDLPAIPQDVIQCTRQPGLPWCAAACEAGSWEWCEGVSLARALGIEAFARNRFRFENERTDDWDSQAEIILAGGEAGGDCDTYAATILHLLAMAGAPPDQLGRALVRVGKGAGSDHQIGLARLGGRWWVIADSLGDPRPLDEAGYRVVWHQIAADGLKFTAGEIP